MPDRSDERPGHIKCHCRVFSRQVILGLAPRYLSCSGLQIQQFPECIFFSNCWMVVIRNKKPPFLINTSVCVFFRVWSIVFLRIFGSYCKGFSKTTVCRPPVHDARRSRNENRWVQDYDGVPGFIFSISHPGCARDFYWRIFCSITLSFAKGLQLKFGIGYDKKEGAFRTAQPPVTYDTGL